MPLLEAATEGARLRFRPVMMTSFAFILGLLPLVVAEGPSMLARRECRHAGVRRHDRRVVHRHFRDPARSTSSSSVSASGCAHRLAPWSERHLQQALLITPH